MDIALRAATIYFVLLLVLRIAGRRTLATTSTFDFILLLIISETVEQAIIGADSSLAGAGIAVATLVGLDIALSLLKFRFPKLDGWIDGYPLVLIHQGVPDFERLRKARITIHDILASARAHGIGTLREIDFAVLEASGAITILPAKSPAPPQPEAP